MGLTRNTITNDDGETLYQCTVCKEFKLANCFEKRYATTHKKYGNSKSLRSECKECRKQESAYYHRTVRLRMTVEQTMKDIALKLKYKADPEISLKKYILRVSKNGARLRNLEHTITIDDIILPKICPILKIPFILGNRKYTYSVDRIDNNKGYIKGNIAIISNLANSMKRDATNEELQAFSKNINDYIKR